MPGLVQAFVSITSLEPFVLLLLLCGLCKMRDSVESGFLGTVWNDFTGKT